MSSEHHSLILGMAIIIAIVVIYLGGVRNGVPADIAVLTGLIGVLGTFTRRAEPKSNVEKADTVNVEGRPE